jgi:hypothetical protein
MGVPNSDVGYTFATARREDHEVHKNMWWHWEKILLKHKTYDLKDNNFAGSECSVLF